MYDEIMELFSALIPTKAEMANMVAGAVAGCLSYALGGWDVGIRWLLFFVVADYATGVLAAFKTGEYTSAVGFRGIFRKAFIFCVVAMCNGLDEIMRVDALSLRNMAIFAYAVNEMASILENAERAGYGHLVPPFIRPWLKTLKRRTDEMGKNLEEKVDIH